MTDERETIDLGPVARLAGITESEAVLLARTTGRLCPRAQAVNAWCLAKRMLGWQGVEERVLAEIAEQTQAWEQALLPWPVRYRAPVPLHAGPLSDIRLAFHFRHDSPRASTDLLRVRRKDGAGAWTLKLCGWVEWMETDEPGIYYNSADPEHAVEVPQLEDPDLDIPLTYEPWYEWVDDSTGEAIGEPFGEISSLPALEVIQLAEMVGVPEQDLCSIPDC